MNTGAEIQRLYAEVAAGLPRFADGRVDYREAKRALVLTVVVVAEGEVLLLKRSDKVGSYRGVWSVNAGFFDEPRPAEELARKELEEETGLGGNLVRRVTVGRPFNRRDETLGVDWVTVPVLIELERKSEPVLDWEHTEARWVPVPELGRYEIVPGMAETVRRLVVEGRPGRGEAPGEVRS
jgi:8-oxo-dGTP diphosphatase